MKTFFGILAILFLGFLALCWVSQMELSQQASQEQATHDAQYGPQADAHGNLDGSVVGRYSAPKHDSRDSGVDY